MKNKSINLSAVLGAVFISSAVSAAEPASNLTDCPLAREPYSINSPLIDLLIDPRAVSAMEGMLPKLGPPFGAKPPTLAATMTLKSLTQYMPALTPKLEQLDKALAQVPVTDEAAVARCARYDHVPPELPAPKNHPALLVFEKITGFLDQPSVDAARKALREMAERRGWSITFTDNGAVFNAAQLKNYDAVVWNNNSGDVLTLSQRAAFETYIKNGGGFAGVHGAGGDHMYLWDWYVNTLIGAQFIGHPMNPQYQTGTVKVERSSDITAVLPSQWSMSEEWYSFASSPRAKGATILATLDESSYKPGAKLAMGAEHPLAWTQCIGNGRSFYTAIGHRPESYSEPNSAKLLEQGIAWSVGVGKTSCKDGKEVAQKSSAHQHHHH
jgi:type 1 glutamine amidotransferase